MTSALLSALVAFALVVTVVSAGRVPGARAAPAPRRGGVLRLMQREDLPQGFSIHETATNSTVWPSLPCFNNLVAFDPLKPVERADTIVGELAEEAGRSVEERAEGLELPGANQIWRARHSDPC